MSRHRDVRCMNYSDGKQLTQSICVNYCILFFIEFLTIIYNIEHQFLFLLAY